jgi:hypothetical protein
MEEWVPFVSERWNAYRARRAIVGPFVFLDAPEFASHLVARIS